MVKYILMIVMLVCASTEQAPAEQITLFDSSGTAIAFMDTQEQMAIYSWRGQAVAYLEGNSVWGFNGKHLGWFSKGIIRDHNGYAVGCVRGAIAISYRPEPPKGLRGVRPSRSLQELKPLKPLTNNTWSATPLSLFLALGRR